MIKLALVVAVIAMVAPGLSAAQTVQNFIIDPNPASWQPGIASLVKEIKSLLKREKTGALEKVVDYFTSTTNPSVVNANNGGIGGIYLYVNEGSLTGVWRRHQIGYGNCYEHAEAFKYRGDKYPGIIASCDNRLVWFENPANSGGDPLSIWPANVIYGNSGCHDFTLADVDGDGKLDVVCSSAAVLGNMQNYILYQDDRNSWSYVAGPGQIGDGVALISVGGGPRNNVVGSAIDGSGVYWFEYPGSRNGVWASHYIGSGDAGMSLGSGTLPNERDFVAIAANESAWPGGLAFFTQDSDPTGRWKATTIDSSYRAVHHPSVGTFEGSPYVLAAEEEQACIAGIDDNDAYHAGIPCRVEIFKYKNGTFERLLLTKEGTQNQSVIPYNGGPLDRWG